MCIQSVASFLLDLEIALGLAASAEADALAEMAAAEIEVTEAAIVAVVVPSAAGDEDAYGSADELRSLPRN